MNKVYIVSSVRTPLGSFGGSLAQKSAIDLGIIATKGAITNAKVDPKKIEEVFMGNVVSANLGQAPARQVALGSGLLNTTPSTTINKVCASGMKSIMLAAQSIQLGHTELCLAGGMESMSNIPYYLPRTRWGMKYGEGKIIDGLQYDGLTDAYANDAMGIFADQTATELGISREEQDEFTVLSYKRSADSTSKGLFKDEIIPVEIPQRRGDAIIISEDEEYKKVRFDKIPNLRPVFTKDGTVTAANASTINDGASALILASEKAIQKYGLTPIAEILSYADAAQEPRWFTTAPTFAAPKALERAGLTIDDVDFFEVNEAFAVVTLAFNKKLKVDINKVNVHGGAVSLGHPLGASGARIVTTLSHVLTQKSGEIGCAAICNGGGGASAMVIKKV